MVSAKPPCASDTGAQSVVEAGATRERASRWRYIQARRIVTVVVSRFADAGASQIVHGSTLRSG